MEEIHFKTEEKEVKTKGRLYKNYRGDFDFGLMREKEKEKRGGKSGSCQRRCLAIAQPKAVNKGKRVGPWVLCEENLDAFSLQT